MISYSFREPYVKKVTVTRKKDGTRTQKTVYHTNFPARNKSGFYQIKEGGRVVYVGFSGRDIYRTLYRHFQKWEHPLQDVIRYNIHRNRYTVSVTYCSPEEAEIMEKKLIRDLKP